MFGNSRFDRELTSLNIGTIGHIDKEKPTLGVVIANTLRTYYGNDKTYSLNPEDSILMEKFDGVIWVVDAQEGITSSAREQLRQVSLN